MLLIKLGGGKDVDWASLAVDIKNASAAEKVVLVHGASKTRDEIAEQLGVPTKTIVSPSGVPSVYTDEKALEVMLMVYAGLINKQIVAHLQAAGINAIGLSGVDGRLWQGKRKEVVLAKGRDGKTMAVRGNFTGRVEEINTGLIHLLLDNDYLPVICAPAISFKGEIINTDNDTAVGLMAGELNADKLVILLEAAGFLKDPNDPNSAIPEISRSDFAALYESAAGRMKKKFMGIKSALDNGVGEVCLGDSRIKHPLKSALTGQGTVIK